MHPLFPLTLAGLAALVPFHSQALNGQTNVQCGYSHTLPDDAIMMPGMPGMAMSHDFFGNTHANAYTTNEQLLEDFSTTCNNSSDHSAYWAPSLRLPDGTVVRPAYQKTYYQASQVEKYPIQPFPAGLQLLAGTHNGTSPNKIAVDYFCQGLGYSDIPKSSCPPQADGTVQMNIALKFPNCWDGVTLHPAIGVKNADYAVNDVCPAAYPVKIPMVNMNIAYLIPNSKPIDMTRVELSLDPVIVNGKIVEQWGSIYSAHGDFMNGWTAQGADFMANHCMNLGLACDTNIPFAYEMALQDVTVSNLDQADKNFAGEETLHVQDNWQGTRSQNKEEIGLIQFTIPAWPAALDITTNTEFTYKIRLFGGNVSDANARTIYLYGTHNDWDEHQVTWNNRPACNSKAAGSLYANNKQSYRYIPVDAAVKEAIKNKQTTISFCIGGERKGHAYAFSSAESPNPPILMLQGFKK